MSQTQDTGASTGASQDPTEYKDYLDPFAPKPKTITASMLSKPPFSVQVPGVEKIPGEGIPRRNPEAVNGLKSVLDPTCRTSYDIVLRGARLFGDRQCLGSRKLIKTHTEKKTIKKVV